MALEVTTRRVELDGFEVLVREAGEGGGPAVLCLHGGPGLDSGYFFPDPDRFGPGLRELAREHRVVVYDQRGCGGSGTPEVDDPLALSRHVDDVEAVRRALELERPAVLAHSFGTVIGLLYAIRYPEVPSRIVVLGGSPDRSFMDGYREAVRSELPPADQVRLAEIQAADLTDELFQERFRIALPLYFHRPLEPDDAKRFVASISYSAQVNRTIALDLESYDLGPALPHVRAPALVVYGESDRVVQPRYQKAFRGQLLTARFVAFLESGHFPFLEEPDAFARVVHYFLAHGDRRPPETPPEEGHPL